MKGGLTQTATAAFYARRSGRLLARALGPARERNAQDKLGSRTTPFRCRDRESDLSRNLHCVPRRHGASLALLCISPSLELTRHLPSTSFETAPDYASALRPSPHVYPAVLRSLQYIAIAINAPLLLCTFAVLPLERILSVSSVLSELGRTSAGKWLGIWVTVDAVVILLATILSGQPGHAFSLLTLPRSCAFNVTYH